MTVLERCPEKTGGRIREVTVLERCPEKQVSGVERCPG